MQKNTLYDTELPGTQFSGAGNAPFVHRISSAELHPTVPGGGVPGAGNAPFAHHFPREATFGAEKHSF